MMLRVLNFVVIGALVLAAAYVYRIKFDSTVQAEHLAKLRGEVRRERDAIAAVRAEWGQLDNPARIEALARRFLQLKPIAPTQFNTLDRLPERPPEEARAASDDPIAGMIGNLAAPDTVTGRIPAATTKQSDGTSEAPVPAPAADQTQSSAASGAPSR